MRRRKRTDFSARAAKNKWDTLQKNVNAVINKKQTVSNIEKDMDVWLKVYNIHICSIFKWFIFFILFKHLTTNRSIIVNVANMLRRG